MHGEIVTEVVGM